MVIALGAAIAITSCSTGAETVTVEDVWSRPVPPVSPASAVYLEITNGLARQVALTSAGSDSCADLQIHETSFDDAGVMSMEEMEAGVAVPAGETITLEPGGIHLMCMSPEVFTGSFEIELRFEGTDDITTTVTIEDR